MRRDRRSPANVFDFGTEGSRSLVSCFDGATRDTAAQQGLCGPMLLRLRVSALTVPLHEGGIVQKHQIIVNYRDTMRHRTFVAWIHVTFLGVKGRCFSRQAQRSAMGP